MAADPPAAAAPAAAPAPAPAPAAADTTTPAAVVAAPAAAPAADTTTTPAAVIPPAAAAADTTTTTPAVVPPPGAAADPTTTTTPVATPAAANTDTTTTAPTAETPAAAAAATTTTTPATPVTPVAATQKTNTNTDADTDTDTDTDTDATTAIVTPAADIDATTGTSSGSSSSSVSSSTSSAKPTINPDLVSDSIVGTWSSKANTVFTGPGFYDPVDELLIEPALPGISYSFTEDGFWEEAIYQVTPNPQNHSCPAAILIFQHGTYTKADNGTLTLTPFEIDGRQLLSQPCNDSGISMYSRYSQKEVFKAYQVYVDPYHGRWRIDLIKSDGSYMQPLYLAYQPPQMLPTITMNPVATGDAASNKQRELEKREHGLELGLADRVKRGLENRYKTNAVKKDSFNYALWWWTSVAMMAVGTVMFVMS